jgi:hypothetical protein
MKHEAVERVLGGVSVRVVCILQLLSSSMDYFWHHTV